MLTTETLWFLAPEVILVLTGVVLYLRGAFGRAEQSSPPANFPSDSADKLRSGAEPLCSSGPFSALQPPGAAKPFGAPADSPAEGPPSDLGSVQIALVGVVLAGWMLARIGLPAEPAGGLILDCLGLYLRWLSLAVMALLVLVGSSAASRHQGSEYLGTLLLLGAGLMTAAVADNLVLLFLALELVSIPTYILLCLGRSDAANYEAAAKYFFLSLLASALVLYGMSFLYGASGSLDLRDIRARLAALPLQEAYWGGWVKIGIVFLLAGLGFKIAAVPFHFYAPDVYQGTTYPNAAVLAAAPKIAGFTALVRVLVEAIPMMDGYTLSWRVVMALGILTMTLGNLTALWQEHLRRLLAYSSIGQAGYILAALTVGLGGADVSSREDGLAAVLLYLAVYALAAIGAFSVLEGLRRTGRPVETLDDLAGLSRHRPWAAAGLAVFMFSLAGVPPLAGFWGKWAVVLGAIKTSLSPSASPAQRVWFMMLAVLTMLNAAVAAAYYLRVAGAAYFRPPTQAHEAARTVGPWIAAVICGLVCVGVGLMPWPLWEAAGQAGEPLVGFLQPPGGSASKADDLADGQLRIFPDASAWGATPEASGFSTKPAASPGLARSAASAFLPTASAHSPGGLSVSLQPERN